MKKFFKNNLKTILAVSATAVICISGTVFATGYFAKDINYTREGSNVKNVAEALNDLYLNNQVKLYDIKNKTTLIDYESSQETYKLNRVNLYNDNLNKKIIIDIQADLLTQGRISKFTIDVSDLKINNILEFSTFKNYELAGNFAVFENTSTKNQISIGIDSNRGYAQKYNYDFKICIQYN